MDNIILYVKEYGKIKEAKIKLAPLTLFVGDNNSGKSYLSSLIWGLYNIGTVRLFSNVCKLGTEAECQLMQWLDEQIELTLEKRKHTISLDKVIESLFTVINECLQKNKGELVKWIFNSSSVRIGELRIEAEKIEKIGELECSFEYTKYDDSNSVQMQCGNKRYGILFDESVQESDKSFFVKGMISALLEIPFNVSSSVGGSEMANIYIPAARTGFMLTKDIVNKVGRDKTFNIQSKIDDEIEVAPFTKPINQFMDEICGLSMENEFEVPTKELAEVIEQEMTYGSVEISNLPGKEIRYLPKGLKESKPLRVSSAVVTELSPLILLFKHKHNIGSLFLEEPEMGLHPQLQQKMGKILVETINTGIKVVSTTHSDIILQHINNMIQLKQHEECEKICSNLKYNQKDLLDKSQVRVYQLTNENFNSTIVEELPCTEYGFEIPTFNDALDKIMNENYEIQE